MLGIGLEVCGLWLGLSLGTPWPWPCLGGHGLGLVAANELYLDNRLSTRIYNPQPLGLMPVGMILRTAVLALPLVVAA